MFCRHVSAVLRPVVDLALQWVDREWRSSTLTLWWFVLLILCLLLSYSPVVSDFSLLKIVLLAACLWKLVCVFPLDPMFTDSCLFPQGAIPGLGGATMGSRGISAGQQRRERPARVWMVLWKTPACSSLLIQSQAFRARRPVPVLSPAELRACWVFIITEKKETHFLSSQGTA